MNLSIFDRVARDSSAGWLTRRECLKWVSAASLGAVVSEALMAEAAQPTAAPFQFHFLLASSLYGYHKLEAIIPQVRTTGAKAIDIWPKVHGDQREQLAEMGEAAFKQLLAQHDVSLGCITQYKLGPFGLQDEMQLAKRLGCATIVTGAAGPKGLRGAELKAAVVDFLEKMKPHLAVAEATGVTVAIENHANNLVDSPDAIRWLADLRPSPHLAIALAPYHLPQDATALADLVRVLGDRMAVFYAWQHGKGSMSAQPKEAELLQMPGRGELDFAPIVNVLREIKYQGWTEVFMHSYPRGTAIHETVPDVSSEVKRGVDYLQSLTPQ